MPPKITRVVRAVEERISFPPSLSHRKNFIIYYMIYLGRTYINFTQHLIPKSLTPSFFGQKMKQPSSKSKPWRPFTANCCSTEDQTIFKNFSRCKPSRSDLSKNIAPLPSFRRLSFSDLSRSSSTRINEDLAQSFGSDLFDFQLIELRAITQNFSSNFLLGEGGFGTVHKGYIDDNLRLGLKAQPVAVKLLDIEGLQGHREWLVSVTYHSLLCLILIHQLL